MSLTLIAVPTLLHFPSSQHLELRHIEFVHVIHMRVDSPHQLHTVVENLPSVLCETLLTELEPGIDELYVRPFPESVVNHCLVLIDGYGTGGVDDVTSRF